MSGLPDYEKIRNQTVIERLARAIQLMERIDRRLDFNNHPVHGANPCPSRPEFTELQTLITYSLQDLQKLDAEGL